MITLFPTKINLCNLFDKLICICYYEYIKDTFSDYIDSLEQSLLKDCKYDLLWDAQAQLYLADKLWQILPDDNKDDMYIQSGTSSGRPWTEIVITEDNHIIPGYNESIFWRIDIHIILIIIR